MARRPSADKLEALKKKRAELDAQIQAVSARQREVERKADTRRKILAGALALEHAEKNPDSEFARKLFRLLDEYVTRPHERALFPALMAAEGKLKAGTDEGGANETGN